MLRTIIADDEPLAVRRLQIALAGIPEVEVVGIAKDGLEALRLIQATSPDLLLLDIKMPGLNGLALVEALEMASPPSVIFISAYDQFAIDAFREGAVDYVLKPLDEERLRQAIARAGKAVSTRDAGQRLAEMREVIRALRQEAKLRSLQYDKEFWINVRGEVRRVPVRDVLWFKADGDYVVLHTRERQYLMHDSLRELETRLDPDRFLRVHRSVIVQRDAVASIERGDFGALRLRLQDGEVVNVGRTYRPVVKDLMSGRRSGSDDTSGTDVSFS